MVVSPVFIAHGSPMMAIEQNDFTDFLGQYGKNHQPKGIIIFTAHWETEILTISSIDHQYDTIYDFRGFPSELYEIQYPAKGSTDIAAIVANRFKEKGISVRFDTTRGLDHGSWVPLSRMFPNAEVPVVQISVNPYLPASRQYDIGEALQGLGNENILIIGSGVTVHNFGELDFKAIEPDPRAVAFDNWLVEKMQNKDLESLFQYEKLAPYARMAVPRAEHFVPLFIALGSGDPDKFIKVLHQSYDYGTLSYLSLEF